MARQHNGKRWALGIGVTVAIAGAAGWVLSTTLVRGADATIVLPGTRAAGSVVSRYSRASGRVGRVSHDPSRPSWTTFVLVMAGIDPSRRVGQVNDIGTGHVTVARGCCPAVGQVAKGSR